VTHHSHHTHRLDWEDVTLREWDCTVLWSDPADPDAGIVLDRSAFYPGGGGQPPDHGVLLWGGVQTRIVHRPERRCTARSTTSGAAP
jgi:misacylated tRNA(Ala) deacylase